MKVIDKKYLETQFKNYNTIIDGTYLKKNQGAANNGKILQIDSSGLIVPVSLINDTTASTSSVYSSSKVNGLLNAKATINDEAATTSSVYSSSKMEEIFPKKDPIIIWDESSTDVKLNYPIYKEAIQADSGYETHFLNSPLFGEVSFDANGKALYISQTYPNSYSNPKNAIGYIDYLKNQLPPFYKDAYISIILIKNADFNKLDLEKFKLGTISGAGSYTIKMPIKFIGTTFNGSGNQYKVEEFYGVSNHSGFNNSINNTSILNDTAIVVQATLFYKKGTLA